MWSPGSQNERVDRAHQCGLNHAVESNAFKASLLYSRYDPEKKYSFCALCEYAMLSLSRHVHGCPSCGKLMKKLTATAFMVTDLPCCSLSQAGVMAKYLSAGSYTPAQMKDHIAKE